MDTKQCCHPSRNNRLKSDRFQFLDAAKTLAIFLVVMYHVAGEAFIGKVHTDDYSTYFYYLVYGIATIGVPLFFTINGYLLLNRPLIFR